MADALAVDDPLSSLPIPPFSPSLFSDDFTLPDEYLQFDDQFFDFTFDDNHHPSDTEELFDSTFNQSSPCDLVSSDPQFNNFVSDPVTVCTESGNLLGNQGSGVSRSLNFPLANSSDNNLLGKQGLGVSRSLNVPSPNNFGRGVVEETVRNLENPASSQGSGHCGSAGSEAAVICPSPDSGNSVVDQKLKRETVSDLVLKRKKESCDVDMGCRTVKQQRSNETCAADESLNQVNEIDEKKRDRLIRNRESAQLSRQRKKQYVEELEEKVRLMHATVQDLKARVAYIAAENAALKQQMVAGAVGGGAAGAVGGVAAGAGVYSPPVMYPPRPAMAPMGYPWMPCPPYVVKSQGSQVPLVPIPKLKTQQPEQKSKKDGKKTEGTSKAKTQTKKVASISFIGLLLFIVLFGGLVPIMNVRFGGVTFSDHPGKVNDYKLYNQQHHGRVLMGDEHVNGTNHNASEPLVASLYVPRNDKLVKIDGSLIINSVLASEKAMAFREKQEMTKEEDTGSAVALDLLPAIPVQTVNRIGGKQAHMYRTSSDHQRALPSNKENLQSKHVDGKLQQWFREGLSGLMLSSGMCTQVFQFDASVASASGAIVPATSAVNITATENRHNSTYITTVKNRRILPGLPIPLPDSTNITKEQVAAGHDSKHEDRHKHNSVSSMVVSVLVDPREARDGSDVDRGMIGGGGGKGKSFSRIFVVVLLDSVKYVTYSCMLPLKGSSHRVTA